MTRCIAGAVRLAACILGVFAAAQASAKPADLIANFEGSFAGIQFLQIRDELKLSADGGYEIDSRTSATGPLTSFNFDPYVRKSTGRINAETGELEIEEYYTRRGSNTKRVRVERGEDIRVTQVVKEDGARFELVQQFASEEQMADELAMVYGFYATGTPPPASYEIRYIGGLTRLQGFRCSDAAERIAVAGDSYDAVRCDRVDRTKVKASFWYLPELGMLPGRAELQIGIFTISFELVDYELREDI